MKKLKFVLASIFLSCVLAGCSNVDHFEKMNQADIVFTDSGDDDNLSRMDLKLPNGIVLSDSEIVVLKELGDKYFFHNSRQCVNDDTTNIDEMIDVLEAEFGEQAKNYYGDEIISEDCIPLMKDCRALEIPTYDDSAIIWVETTVVKHWGAWWCSLEYTATVKGTDKNYGGKKKLRVDSALCEYKDSTTSKISKTYDWRYLDNPENKPEGIYESMEWESAEANRGIVNVEGDTKYGFFPDVNNMTCIVIYYDPLIVGGSFVFGSTY